MLSDSLGTEIILFHLMVHDDRNVFQVALGQRYADGSRMTEIDQGLVVVAVKLSMSMSSSCLPESPSSPRSSCWGVMGATE